jgi:flagellar motor switch protein FliN/FliY
MAAAAIPKPEVAVPDPWASVEGLPCTLTVEIPAAGFRVTDLVHLCVGRIIATRWRVGIDVPLRVNGELIAWSEFEIVQNKLAMRLTELA